MTLINYVRDVTNCHVNGEFKKVTLTPDEIKQRLGWGGLTKIAKATGYTKGHVSQVINGLRRHRKVEVAVARRLREKADDVFPPEGKAA